MEIVHLNRKASNKSRERYYISLVSSFIENFIKTISCPNAMQHDLKSCTSTQKVFSELVLLKNFKNLDYQSWNYIE